MADNPHLTVRCEYPDTPMPPTQVTFGLSPSYGIHTAREAHGPGCGWWSNAGSVGFLGQFPKRLPLILDGLHTWQIAEILAHEVRVDHRGG